MVVLHFPALTFAPMYADIKISDMGEEGRVEKELGGDHEFI